jgi:hypothetical protein
VSTDPKTTDLTALLLDVSATDAVIENMAIDIGHTLRDDAFSLTAEDVLAMGAAMADIEAWRSFSAGNNDALAGRGEFVEYLIEQVAEWNAEEAD